MLAHGICVVVRVNSLKATKVALKPYDAERAWPEARASEHRNPDEHEPAALSLPPKPPHTPPMG
jgi:hypothetical protein